MRASATALALAGLALHAGAVAADPPAPLADRERIVSVELGEALAPAWEKCGGSGRVALVTVESTHGEVVDVTGAYVSGPPDPRLVRCLTEAAWDLELPDAFRAERGSFEVSL